MAISSIPKDFWKDPSYTEKTHRELRSSKTPAHIYEINLENQNIRQIKKVIICIFFPLYLASLAHSYITNLAYLHLSTEEDCYQIHSLTINTMRPSILDNDSSWKVKRVALKIDGFIIDAMIMGKAKTFDNGRWLLHATGGTDSYESIMSPYGKKRSDIKNLASSLDANLISFNYVGVGASQGKISTSALKKSYLACLHFLEDSIKAKEVISYGHSLGGAVAGEALSKHSPKEGVKYISVQDRTFSKTSEAAYLSFSKRFDQWIHYLALKMTCSNLSSKIINKPQISQIVLQTSSYMDYKKLTPHDLDSLIDDGSIPSQACLAKSILESDDFEKTQVFGIPERHDENFQKLDSISNLIRSELSAQV